MDHADLIVVRRLHLLTKAASTDTDIDAAIRGKLTAAAALLEQADSMVTAAVMPDMTEAQSEKIARASSHWTNRADEVKAQERQRYTDARARRDKVELQERAERERSRK